MMSAVIRQLCCNIIQERQLVNVKRVISTTLSQSPRHFHDNVIVSSENQETESQKEKSAYKNKEFTKSSFNRLRRSGEHSLSNRKESDQLSGTLSNRKESDQLSGTLSNRKEPDQPCGTLSNRKESDQLSGILSDDGSTFSDKGRSFRGSRSDLKDFKRERNFIPRDGDKFSNDKSTFKRAKKGKFAYGSGNKYGQVYSNSKFPVKGEILFGYHPVTIALTQGQRHCHKIFVQQGRTLSPDVNILALAQEAKIPVEQVSRIHLDQLCLGRPHQGICMDSEPLDIPNLSPEDVRTAVVKPPPIWVLPHEVVDPMNMGGILRSCYYFGVDTVVIPSHHSATASPMVSKASSGAMEVMKLFYLKNKEATQQFLQDWKENIGQVIGTATGPNTLAVTDCTVDVPTLLIVGNEHHGLKRDILQHCDQVVKLKDFSDDRRSMIGSINVSVATGIVLHALKNNTKDEPII